MRPELDRRKEAATAPVDYFLKIDGIAGESADAKHKNEIELVSFSWGATQSGAGAGAGPRGGGGGAGRVQIKPFEFTMKVNKASPQLFLAVCNGQHIKEANLSVRRAGKAQLEYLKIKFTDVLVSSYDQSAAEEGPYEMVALNFGRIEFQYSQQNMKGAAGDWIKASWDLTKNQKV